MNVAALVHPNDPNDDPRQRQPRQEPDPRPPPPPQQQPHSHRPPHHSPPLERPRDRDRERDRPSLDAPHHAQQPPPLQYRRSPPPQYASRPPSPPRHQYSLASDYPGQPQQRHHLPPPSSLYSAEPYELSHQQGRRGNPDVHAHSHDRLGPPGQQSQPVQAQPYVVEHRNSSSHSSSIPPKSLSHHHHHHHAQPLPSTSSSGYMHPPSGRSSLHSSPPLSHHIHGPGPGSIPLFPTQVGPGIPPSGHPMHAPPGPHGPSGPPGQSASMGLRMGEPNSYGMSHQNQGPPPPHHSHQIMHSHSSSSLSHQERQHRVRGSSTSSSGPPGPGGAFDHNHRPSNTASPVMASLQRPAFDERDPREREREPGPSTGGRPRGPPGAGMPPGSALGSIVSSAIAHGRSQDGVTQLLGPGLHPSAMAKDRDRERGMERAMERERERRDSGASMQESPGSARRERDQRERDREREIQRERMKERERERDRMERHAQREREEQRMREVQRERERESEAQREEVFRRQAQEMMTLGSVIEREGREREYMKGQQAQTQGHGHPNMRVQLQPQPPMQTMGPPPGEVWSRFVQPRGPSMEDGRIVREHERSVERRPLYEDARMQDLEWEAEKVERAPARSSKSRSNPKEREERERVKATQREERRSKVNAGQREKEREKVDAERREKEKALEREHQLAMEKEVQYQIMERERREIEAMRGRAREPQGPPQGPPSNSHLHAHHNAYPPNQAYPSPQPQGHARSSSKQGAMTPQGLIHIPGPGDMPPQFPQDRDPQFRQGSSKATGPSALSQVIPPPPQHQPPPHLMGHHPQHLHQLGPGPHLRQHPADMYGPGGPLGYPPRRLSPPPFHPGSAPPIAASFVFPRSATPPPTLILPIRHLGTFIYPRTPFPFVDFPGPVAETGAPSDPIDIRATLFIPSRFIPLTRPVRPRIWGGSLIPAVPPLTAAQRQLVQQFSGGLPGYGRPEQQEIRDGRRVYTDDSDLFLCALHAGWVSWSAARRARREGKDLRLEVRLTREARFVGGLGQALRKKDAASDEDAEPENDGSSLLSSGWGNGHDGSGVEILNAEFVASGTAHSFGLRNRSQRLLEYAERRCALGCAPRSGRKRRRLHAMSFADVSESPLQLRLDQVDDDLSSTRIMVFGTDASWPEIGFKYHPDALRDVLFPQPAAESRPSKRRKVGASPENATSEPATDAGSDDGLSEQRAVVVETMWESFLISQRGQIPSGEGESDKENAGDSGDGGGRRYVIAVLTNAGGTSGKLPRPRPKAQDSQQQSVPAPDTQEAPKPNGVHTHESALPVTDAPTPTPSITENGSTLTPLPEAPQEVPVNGASKEPTPTPSKASDESTEATDDANGPIQILHHNLSEENFEFLPDGIHVLSSEVENGMRKGWKLQAQQWKWVQVGVSS
ncbi:hypothetical protein VTO73DRAFT_7903 [Trametes versicolor]